MIGPRILITAKINPDLDGVACAYAYGRLLKQQGQNTTEGIFGQPHVEAQYLIDRFDIDDVNYAPQERFDKFILVDASDTQGMPEVVRPKDVIEVIDHRERSEPAKAFPNAKIQVEKVGAAATLIAEKYQEAGVCIDPNSAVLLYGAIYSQTLNLRANVTKLRDGIAAVWLKDQAKIPPNLVHQMFMVKTAAISQNLTHVLEDDFKRFPLRQNRFGITQLEVVELQRLVDTALTRILAVLQDLKQEFNLEFVFLTAVDLERNFNLFVTADTAGQSLLNRVFGVKFKNNVAKREGLILRKEITPLINLHI